MDVSADESASTCNRKAFKNQKAAIVKYCYTTSISATNISTHLRASNLLLASTKFGLDALAKFSLQVTRALDVQSFPTSLEGKTIMVPNSKLDLSALINDDKISDLRMRTKDNGVIHVHRCILLAQVPSSASQIKDDVIDVSNMSHDSVQRVVEFVYTGKITANLTQEQTLEDIVTAKQIGANAMLSKLQTLVKVTDDNSLDVLKVALVNDLSLLKSMALRTLEDKDYDLIFDRIKLLEDSCSTIVSEFNAIVQSSENKRTRKSPQLIQGISFRGCLGLVATSAASLFLLRMEMNDFLVASANVCFLVVTIYFFL